MTISRINTNSITNGEVHTDDLADEAVTQDKLHTQVVANIDSDISAGDAQTRILADGDSLLNSLIFGG